MIKLKNELSAECVQIIKNRVALRLATCKARLKAGTILSSCDEWIEYTRNGEYEIYVIESADAMERFFNNDNIDFNKLSAPELVQIIKALMEYGNNDKVVVDYLMALLQLAVMK